MQGGRNIQANPVDEEDDENEDPHTNISPCSLSSPSSTCMDEVCEVKHAGVRRAQDSKFKDLIFRQKLKARGRPKRADVLLIGHKLLWCRNRRNVVNHQNRSDSFSERAPFVKFQFALTKNMSQALIVAAR